MKVAVVGVTGLVGTRMVEVLEERNFPVDEFIPVASGRSAGKLISFKGKEYPVVTAEEAVAMKPDLALFSAGADISKEWAPKFAAVGCRVVDNSSCWRMDPTKKLVVPEINADVLTEDDYIIANPNCTTIQMVVALQAIEQISHIKRVHVATYQAASGAGAQAMKELETQYRQVLNGEDVTVNKFAYQLAYNVIPHIDVFTENGYTKEEMKMFNETRKIMHSDVKVSATCVRVPSLRAHSESIWIETEKPVSVSQAKAAFANAKGCVLMDDPENKIYPMPLFLSGKDEVFIGRIRKDISDDNGLSFWCVSDQIRKGAALNAVQIAEYLNGQNDK